MRINTDGKYQWREDLYDDIGELLDGVLDGGPARCFAHRESPRGTRRIATRRSSSATTRCSSSSARVAYGGVSVDFRRRQRCSRRSKSIDLLKDGRR
jgi:hypothetical protein